tara:strand:- start:15835 stop:16656 length:822 start_codon:yes stop_codon:yes gene_type:complete
MSEEYRKAVSSWWLESIGVWAGSQHARFLSAGRKRLVAKLREQAIGHQLATCAAVNDTLRDVRDRTRDWKGATLFDACDRAEWLTHTDVEEAIAEAVAGVLPRYPVRTDAEVAAWLRAEETEIEVVGYRRMSLDSPKVRAAALASRAVDMLHEHGVTDPDDIGGERERRLTDAFLATLVHLIREEGGPWGCEEVVRHTYDAEAIVAALRLEAVSAWTADLVEVAPGSPEAIAAGCTCPRIDNAHGCGQGTPPRFFISGACLVHAHGSEINYDK